MNVERRRFLQATAGAAAVLAGCGDNEENQAVGPIAGERGVRSEDEAGGQGSHDLTVLQELLDHEHETAAAYAVAARTLTGDAQRAARGFREHEREHARTLQRAIRDLDGRPNEPRGEYGFDRLRDQEHALRFLAATENRGVEAYVDAIPRLNAPELRATLAAVVNGAAQHLVVLHQALDQRAVPTAFVTGEVEEEAA